MRNWLHLILALVILMSFGCGNKKSTAPPLNHAPKITALLSTPNPLPRNQTADLTVTATDEDGDSLTYAWSAGSGSFASGGTTSHAVWVPPQTLTSYQISVIVSDGKDHVDSTISIVVSGGLFNLSGQIRNQGDNAATNLYVVERDSQGHTDSVRTNINGNYSFSNVPEGDLTINLRSSEIVINELPRYIDKDTSISLNENTVLNLGIREFNTIFYDDGTMSYQWSMYGGVRNDGNKYIFEDYLFYTDHMIMSSSYHVPSNTDASNLYFLVEGEAAPSDSSRLKAYLLINGVDQGIYWNMVYHSTPQYYIGWFQGITNIAGNNIQLDFEFDEYAATFIYARKIWVFNY